MLGVEYRVFDGEALALLLRGEEGMTHSHTMEPRLPSVSTCSTNECSLDVFCLSLPMAILYGEHRLTIKIIKIRKAVDYHEFCFHLLEVMVTTLTYERGPPVRDSPNFISYSDM